MERSLEEGHQSFVDTRSQLEEVEKKVSTGQEGEYLGVGVLGKKGGVVVGSIWAWECQDTKGALGEGVIWEWEC